MRTRLMRRLPSSLTRQAGEIFLRWLQRSAEEHTRRVVALFGEDRYRIAGILAGTVAYRNARRSRKSQTCVYLADTFSTPFQVFQKHFWRQLPVPHHRARTFLREVVWERAWTRLGTTNEILVLDLSQSLWPNRIGMMVETLRGGGVAFLLFPKQDVWLRSTLKHHLYLTSDPHTAEEVQPTFETFFLENLWYPGILQIHLDDGWLTFQEAPHRPPSPPHAHPSPEGEASDLSSLSPAERVRRLTRTRDQAQALDALLQFGLGGPETPPYLLLLANRGRGKSYVLGLFLSALGSLRSLQVAVVVPHEEGRSSVLAGMHRAAQALRMEVRETEGHATEVGSLRVGWFSPADAFPAGLDLVVVDEAAGIPIPQLMRLAHLAPRAVFATTVHGYEGTGRGFTLRFQKHLKRHGVQTVTMEEPIRYAAGDPVEAWLYRTLLLDAEPEPPADVPPETLPVYPLDRRALFLNPAEHRRLRNFVGIYIHAHYRNEPNDLLLLANAPHVEAWALGEHAEAGALEIAREGSLDEERIAELLTDYDAHQRLQGHILPALMIRYYGEIEIPKRPGARVVRIAVHPDRFGQGLGSRLLRAYVQAVQGERHWIGTSFGLTPQLVRFWKRQGFFPFHVAPGRNARSGEYSSAWILPLQEDLTPRVLRMGRLLRERLVLLLDRTYRDMEGELALLLLEALPPVSRHLTLDEDARFRLRLFRNRLLPWGMVWDVARAVALRHFLAPELDLSLEENLLILENFLRGNDAVIHTLARRTGDTPRWWKVRSHEVFNALVDHYLYP